MAAPSATAAPVTTSVSIPTRDRPATAVLAVRSVLAQTRQDFEVIVVDDSTTTETAQALQALGDPRVRIERSGGPGGMAAAFNRCVDLARGRFVALLHDDDLWAPDYLQVMVGHLEADPGLGLAFCGARFIDPQGTVTGTHAPYPGPRRFARGELLLDLVPSNRILAPTVIARRSTYEAVGPYRDGLLALDWDMWLRMAARFAALYEPRGLASYRRGHGSMTDQLETPAGWQALNREAARLTREAGALGPEAGLPQARRIARAALAERWAMVSSHSLRQGRMGAAAQDALRGLAEGWSRPALPVAALGLVAFHAACLAGGGRGRRFAASVEERFKDARRRRLARNKS